MSKMKHAMRIAECAMHRNNGIYEHNVDPRRRQEMMDFRLLSEDCTQMANLPSQPINREMPRAGNYPNGFLITFD